MKITNKKPSESYRYLIKYFYIGSQKYHGSQRQSDLPTIEASIISALKEKKYIGDSKESKIEFASRTDKFVSARGAAFTFMTKKKPILMEINTVLPREIGLWGCAKVKSDFLSRFNAFFRYYKYIYPVPPNNLNNININLMQKACKEFEGRHDFSNFSKKENEVVKVVRDINLATVKIIENYLIFDFKSRAFLRQQIRRMVKKILEIGFAEIEFDHFLSLFDPSKPASYQPADPKGLILWDVDYGDAFTLDIDKKSIERMENYFEIKKQNHGLKHQLFSILQQDNLGE